ncbi:MAG: glycosyltransferase [Candidatus Competibacteraceae bacterium]|nr:glycosyltransferase [Candidatus Competibacteraceae bacterium]
MTPITISQIKNDPELDEFQLYPRLPESLTFVQAIQYSVANRHYYNLLFQTVDRLCAPVFALRLEAHDAGAILWIPSLLGSITPEQLVTMINRAAPPARVGQHGFQRPDLLSSDLFTLLGVFVRYRAIAQPLPVDARVLDFGCGVGLGSLILSAAGYRRLTALDSSQSAIEQAQSFLGADRIDFRTDHLDAIDGEFDAIIASEVLEHIRDWPRILSSLRERLHPAGQLLITLPNWRYHGSHLNPDHVKDWGRAGVRRLFYGQGGTVHGFPTRSRPDQKAKLQALHALKPAASEFFLIRLSRDFRAHVPVIGRVLLVAHAIAPFAHSGVAVSTLVQAEALRRLGIAVAVLVSDPQVNRAQVDTASHPFPVYHAPGGNFFDIFQREHTHIQDIQPVLQAIESVIEQFRPEVVHLNDYLGFPSRILKLLHDLGCVVIRQVRNIEELCLRANPVLDNPLRLCSDWFDARRCLECNAIPPHPQSDYFRTLRELRIAELQLWRDFLQQFYRRHVDGLVFASAIFRERFLTYLDFPAECTRIIPLSLDAQTLQAGMHDSRARPDSAGSVGASSRSVRFLFIGSLQARKGAHLLTAAVQRLREQGYANFELRVAGVSESFAPEIHAEILAAASAPDSRIRYLGPYQPADLGRLLQDVDVGLTPSLFETACRTLQEFLVMGIPVIAHRFFGSEIVTPGENGLLMDCGEAADLAEAMRTLLDDPALLAHLRNGAARTRIATPDQEAADLLAFYEEMATSRFSAMPWGQ